MNRKLLSLVAAAALLCAAAIPALADGKVQTYGKGWRADKNGWVYIHIEGEPYERGFQHGYLAAPELKKIKRSLEYLTYEQTGKTWEFFYEAAATLWADKIPEEFMQEIKGIADGATKAGVPLSWKEVLAWTGYEELTDYWWPNVMEKYRYLPRVKAPADHCSAFMATGSATKGGKIVMAHNTFDNFEWGQFSNMILDIVPSKGYRIFMQSEPGHIDSGTDFFITGAGLMGLETTIGGFSLYDANEVPEFARIRAAMQYSNDLDHFVKLMEKKNNGGYANSWLVGDRRSGEIMRLEMGLKFYNVEKKKDGWFIGFNAPLDPRIRNLECSNTGYSDLRRHQGARRVRLTQLMRQYNGKIDVEVAKLVLADHYDPYLKKENPCSRTIDSHYELDDRAFMSDPSRPEPFQPRGAVDGKCADSDMAAEWRLWARWGNSSGMPFDAKKFLAEHIEWDQYDGYLLDRPSQPWTVFEAGMRP